jgi:hypothetical protein
MRDEKGGQKAMTGASRMQENAAKHIVGLFDFE